MYQMGLMETDQYIQKVASDLGLGGGICQVLRFPPQLTTG